MAGFTIHVDTREKYAFRFARRDVTIEHTTVEAGDYVVRVVGYPMEPGPPSRRRLPFTLRPPA